MVTKVCTGAILGVACQIVTVEVDVSNGLPQVEMVGKLSAEVREARMRVRVALKNIGITLPPKRITINLAPAALPKEGTAYDLPIAVALLAAIGMVPERHLDRVFIAGELGLNGEVKPVRGVLPMALEARAQGLQHCLLAAQNVREGQVVSGLHVAGFADLQSIVSYLQLPEERREDPPLPATDRAEPADDVPDYDEIYGQEAVKRVMEIAAAGFHNVLMVGPPGAGKTMAARRLPGILPPISEEERLEVSKVYSVAGLLRDGRSLVETRPFIAPHHSATLQALAGGGRVPTPGLISRAHKGVLFLDEAVHFSSAALEVLRQPLEEKRIMVARSSANYEFPAEFMLVMAINPCPCGNYPDPERCRCTQEQVRRYLGRLSGPLLDRIDLSVEMGRLPLPTAGRGGDGSGDGMREIAAAAGAGGGTGQTRPIGSAQMRERVMAARKRQEQRFAQDGARTRFNAQMGVREIERHVALGAEETAYMAQAYERMHMSLRSYHRVLRVARTIADIDGAEAVTRSHLGEALCYRGIEDRYWGKEGRL